MRVIAKKFAKYSTYDIQFLIIRQEDSTEY